MIPSFLRDLVDFFSFRIRRLLLWSAAVSSATLGTYYWHMPGIVRLVFLPTYIVLIELAFLSNSYFFVHLTRTAFGSLVLGRRYKPAPYTDSEIDALKQTMRIPKKTKVYVTNNPHAQRSAFTNVFSSKVYLPLSWIRRFHKSEIIAIIAHEFGHIKRRWQFSIEATFVVGLAYGLAILLSQLTVMLLLVFDVLYVSVAFILIGFVSRRNEYRADREGAKAVGPEGLISVFEELRANMARDDGSETHPPLSKRIRKLKKLLSAT